MSSLNSFNIESLKEGNKNSDNKNEKDEEIQNSKESNNIELNILDNLDVQKIKELNSKCVDFIFQDKTNIALEILKKIELFLESNIIESKFNFDTKLIIIILHNIACSYQKLKDYNNCITYLDGVVHHFDKELEKKHQIKISEEYFYQNLNTDQSNYPLLGDLILELRFSAKFHLQMCAALSQANKHIEALKHAKLACLICEDNIIKTYYLFFQMKLKNLFSNENKNKNDNDKDKDEEDEFKNSEKMKLIQKVVQDLFNRITNLRKQFNNEKDNEIKKNNNSYYNSYLNYRKNEIHEYQKNTTLLYVIRNSFGTEVKEDDWIQLLTLQNIIYLSPLNNEDLDLDSDPKYELLRDAILEKVVMLTVSFFCVALEMKQLSPDKNNKKANGEFFHHKSVCFSNLYLPVSCSIVKHFINSYYKYYGKDLDVVPEGKIVDYKIDLIKNEIEMNKDPQSFLRIQRMNYSNNVINNNNDLNIENINQDVNKDYINNIGNKKDKFPFSLKLNLNLGNILNKNNNNNNEMNNNTTKNKKLSPTNDKKQLNNSNNIIRKQNKENIENNNFTIIPNKNSLQFAEKSKIKEMPKFKLNFNKLNNLSNSVEENMSNDKITQNNNKNKIKKISTKISIYNKKFRHSTSNNKINKSNVSKNKGYKTERSNSNNKPINIDETLKINQRKKSSKIYIKKISFNKSFYQSQYLSKTSRYQKKKSPTIDNKGKIKGNLTDRAIADKNKSIRKSNEKNKHKSYSKKNIEHLTQKELIKLDLREKVNLNLNNSNNINSIKNNITNSSNILKPIKSNNSSYNENYFNNLYNKIKHNNLANKIISAKKKITSNNKNLMKNNKKEIVDKMNKKLYIELKNNTIYVNNNYGNILDYSKCERSTDQINNFNSLIKINPFKS